MAQNSFPQINVRGRLLMDGGVSFPEHEGLANQLGIVDMRLGTKVKYGRWSCKLDVGFANDRLSLKDAYLQYAKDANQFRLGYMLGYFGMDQCLSTCDYLFNTGAGITTSLYPGRRNGFSYTRSEPHYSITNAWFLGDKLTMADGKPGFNSTLRAIWRPINDEFSLLHLGVSAYYRVPDFSFEKGDRSISLTSGGVTYLPSSFLQSVNYDHVKDQCMFGTEFLAFHNNWMFQMEYLLTSIRQSHDLELHPLWGSGGYFILGYLLKGHHYGYDCVDSVPMMPCDSNSLLLLIRFNLTDIDGGMVPGPCRNNSVSKGIYQKDVTIGLDYFVNDSVSTRMGYSYVALDDSSLSPERSLHIFQARIQFRF